MMLSTSLERSVWMAFAAWRAGSAITSIFLRCCVILLETTRGRIESESRDTMMKTTGTIVVHVLSGPTRQMLRRSMSSDGFNPFLEASKALAPTDSYIFQPMLRDDRREFQRLKLSKPILATMGTANALILDIGIAGAFLEHFGTAEAGEQF